jgi:hypothetical protein
LTNNRSISVVPEERTIIAADGNRAQGQAQGMSGLQTLFGCFGQIDERYLACHAN